ncbi:hypothetical protein IAU59_007273 [Kwoniella sp. CBS 9459]
MTKTLLDLSDELLVHIASFLHRDNAVPLPSFGPHWLNLYSEFDPTVAEDYYNFRLTCKKVNGICPLRGLHYELTSLRQLDRMLTETPREALNGIRRMRVMMVDARGSTPKATSAYARFINLLQSLPNLEELIIVQSPFCDHSTYSLSGAKKQSLRITPSNFLPNLKSLSLDMCCLNCKVQVPSLIVPAAPQLKRLRMAIGANSKDPTYGPVKALTMLSSAWQDQQPDTTIPITELFLRISPSDAGHLNTLHQINKVFPHLEHLHISPHYHASNRLNPGLAIVAEQLDHGWSFEVEDPLGSGLVQPLSILLDRLKAFQQLKSIDGLFVICLKDAPRRPILHTPVQGETQIEYLKLSQKAARAVRGLANHDKLFEQAIRQVVGEMSAKIPKLASGAFWEFSKDRNQASISNWYKWDWRTITIVNDLKNGNQSNGKVDGHTDSSTRVHIDRPKRFTAKFVNNRLGVVISRPLELIEDTSYLDSESSDGLSDSESEDGY